MPGSERARVTNTQHNILRDKQALLQQLQSINTGTQKVDRHKLHHIGLGMQGDEFYYLSDDSDID